MGKGNVCKSATKRKKNEKKKKNTAKSQLKTNKTSMNIKCEECFQAFMGVSNKRLLTEHSENKHPKKTFAQCFPNFESSNNNNN
eukprot:TRINITY_DN1779_c0_g2_i2.p1 TRINITY_DN1779_c0_g2~~TRINITY_DN1779_c0_g2_i2.p1  ORF type:complete len:84 (+),score=5.36 TRINITY_DN1779_c0_g2_i2:32-283(+)